MGNGNRTSGGGGGGAVTPWECDVGLGLKTEQSYPCKKMSLINHHRHDQASEIGSDFGGVYGNNGILSQLFVNPTNTTNQTASGISFESTTDGVIGASGKVLFTPTQWQELERQTMIYKYMMASIPVPQQLLLPSSTQSNRMSTGLRFSNGSDPEPWRCRRTDGKKWRCSRDVAPDQKYCERHAHKTRSRSRKPAEIQSHNTKDDYQPLLPSADMNHSNNNNKNRTRCTEWFVKSGAMIPVSQSNNQSRQPLDSPSGGSKRDDCSLTLSMQSGGKGIEFDDQESFQMAVRMLDADRGGCGDVFRSQHQWLNPASWAASNPGGPLGEALCLGITSTANMPPNVPSPHCYSNSTATSGSCEGGDGRAWFH